MSLLAAALAAGASLVQTLMGVAATTVKCAATANGAGLDGIAVVKAWPGGWKATAHAANVFSCISKGLIGPWRWVPVQVDPRLVVFTMHDALSIGTNPHCRIPINESNCQRIADMLGAQLGKKLLIPTPKIADAVHLHAAQGNGRAVPLVSIWNDPTEPPASDGKVKNQGQNVDQWIRQQERLKKAVAAAGGYPASGVVSTVGKDVVLAPRIVDIAKSNDMSGEGPGPKMMIYGWHTKQKPAVPPFPPSGNPGPWVPDHLPKELQALGWLSIQQSESGKHGDLDTGGATGLGGFWDYSSVIRYVLDDCLLDGKPAKLTTVYATAPELVYEFRGAPRRPIAVRYPMVPAPAPGA